MIPNRSLSERYGDAIMKAAEAKSEASRTEKLAKRVFAACFLDAAGKNAEERKQRAMLYAKYMAAEDEAMRAETAANLARAEADALNVAWETWRTENATRRAEMNLR